MTGMLRKALFAVPFACAIALAVHGVRFGDDHAFGGEANGGIVSAAIGGSIAIGCTILHLFLTAGSTTPTGTLAAVRARALVPGMPALFALSAALYYGIESLEGNGIEIGLPTLLLAVFSVLAAAGLHAVSARFAGLVARLVRDCLELLGRRSRLGWQRSLEALPIRAQIFATTRHPGRAPPNGRRVF